MKALNLCINMGKPTEKWGRKATGPYASAMAARPQLLKKCGKSFAFFTSKYIDKNVR